MNKVLPLVLTSLLISSCAFSSKPKEGKDFLTFTDGMADPIMSLGNPNSSFYKYDSSDIVRFVVYVETNYDTDGDGKLDLVRTLVETPKAAVEGKYKAATIIEAIPYCCGINDRNTPPYKEGEFDMEKLYSQPKPRELSKTISTKKHAQQQDKKDWFNRYDNFSDYNYYLKRGYAYVATAGIGTLGSEGFMTNGLDLETDAFKCVVEWLHGDRKAFTDKYGTNTISAEWSNGKCAMTGASYGGTIPYQVATTGVEGLETIVPECGIASWYQYCNAQGLSLQSITNTDWLAAYCASRYLSDSDYSKIEEEYGKLLTQMHNDEKLSQGDYSDFWKERDYLDYSNIDCSALIVQGVHDNNVRTVHADLMYKAFESAQKEVKMILHQQGHYTLSQGAGTYEHVIDGISYDDLLNKWYSHYLYDIDNGIENYADLTVEDNLTGEWKHYSSWLDTTEEIFEVDSHGYSSSTVSSLNMPINLEGWHNNDNYLSANSSNLVSYSIDVEEDMTIKGAVKVSFDASVEALGSEVNDVQLMASAYLVDTCETPFHAYKKDDYNGLCSYEIISSKTSHKSYDEIITKSVSATTSIIGEGHADLYNPQCGYIASSPRNDNVLDGNKYTYNIYLYPNTYRVERGHTLKLMLFTFDPNITEDYGRFDFWSPRDYSVNRPYSYTINNSSIRVTLPLDR